MSKPSIGQLKTLVGVDTANPPVETVAVPPLHQAYIKTRDRNYFRFSYGILDKLGSGGESTIFRGQVVDAHSRRHEVVVKRFADSMYLPWDVLPKGAKGEIAAMKKLQDCIIVNRPVATAITPYGHDAIFPHVMDCTMQLVADTIHCFRDKKEEMETLLSTLLPPFIVLLSRALRAMADAGIRHGDLKLSNMLVSLLSETAPGSFNRFKVSDFGHSYVLKDYTKQFTDVYRGTTGYRPPEIESNNFCHPNSDLYSFGMCIYRFCGVSFQDAKADGSVAKESPSPSWLRKLWLEKEFSWLYGTLNDDPEGRRLPSEGLFFPNYANRETQDIINELGSAVHVAHKIARERDSSYKITPETLSASIASRLALCPTSHVDPADPFAFVEPVTYNLEPAVSQVPIVAPRARPLTALPGLKPSDGAKVVKETRNTTMQAENKETGPGPKETPKSNVPPAEGAVADRPTHTSQPTHQGAKKKNGESERVPKPASRDDAFQTQQVSRASSPPGTDGGTTADTNLIDHKASGQKEPQPPVSVEEVTKAAWIDAKATETASTRDQLGQAFDNWKEEEKQEKFETVAKVLQACKSLAQVYPSKTALAEAVINRCQEIQDFKPARWILRGVSRHLLESGSVSLRKVEAKEDE